ncbi:MAG: glutathione S-transferase family protein [Pseudomonadales bacterium]
MTLILHTAATPNGWKASVTLEELQLPYEVQAVDLGAGEQKQPAFLKMNPNGRVPVLVDDGFAVFESGAIMLYLAERSAALMPADVQGRSRVLQWLMFQMGGVGPMMGQANVFYRAMEEKIEPAIARYQNETRRLFEVLNQQLARQEWLADDFSIADIANWCWVRLYFWAGVELADLPHLSRWLQAMEARPACQRGIAIPHPLELPTDPEGVERVSQTSRRILQR